MNEWNPPRGPLTDFEKSLLGEHPVLNEHPIIVYRDIVNVWACRVCPSVNFHLYSDGNARCAGCALMAPEFISAYPDLDAARQRLRRLEKEIRSGDKLLQSTVSALGDLIAVFDGHPHLPCEDGELPALDRARERYREAVRFLADAIGLNKESPVAWRFRIGMQNLWSYAESKEDAEFHIRASGVKKYELQPLFASPPQTSAIPCPES